MTAGRTRTGLSRRILLGGAAATLVLAAASTVGLASASGAFTSTTTASCVAPVLDGAVVLVTEADMGRMPLTMMGRASTMRLIANPITVRAGIVSLLVHNSGSRTHELVVLPLPDNQSAGARTVGADGRIEETGSLGEASRSCAAGAGDGIRAGSIGWVTTQLSPGRYELVCNERNHYAAGMFAELDVT